MNDAASDRARPCRDRMFADDAASRGLGMQVEAVGSRLSKLSMTVRADMLNGFKTCHGGFITTLADSAFAFACNSHNEVTVAVRHRRRLSGAGARRRSSAPPTAARSR